MSYAEETTVPVSRSQEEIRKLLQKYGATGFAFGEQLDRAVVMFELKYRRIRFILPYPPKPAANMSQKATDIYNQALRSRWRALLLSIKAKFTAVEAGIVSFEDEFLAQIQLPDGRTVGETMKPQINRAYLSGKMPPLLGFGS